MHTQIHRLEDSRKGLGSFMHCSRPPDKQSYTEKGVTHHVSAGRSGRVRYHSVVLRSRPFWSYRQPVSPAGRPISERGGEGVIL